jgi:hypothetical protein
MSGGIQKLFYKMGALVEIATLSRMLLRIK